MTDLTLPGTIPGLLRRGSPVFWRDEETPFVVTWIGPWPDSDTVEDGAIVLAAPATSPCIGVEDNVTNFVLDLTCATGRAHAAWWLLQRYAEVSDLQKSVAQHFGCSPADVYCVVSDAAYEELMTDDRTDFLRRVVLFVAGIDDNG